MRPSAFIDSAVKQASAQRRLRGRAVIERALDTLASGATFNMLGLNDREEVRTNIIELRRAFDVVLSHYYKHGGRYLPAIDTGIDYRFSWMLILIYVVTTRASVPFHGLGRVFQLMLKTNALINTVSKQLLHFVSDYKQWEDHDMAIKRILYAIDLPWRPAADFEDGGDILAVANLLGFTMARVVNVDSIDPPISDEVKEQIESNFPPMIYGTLGDKLAAAAKKAFAINAFHMESGLMDYVGTPCPDTKTAEAIKVLLQSAGKIPMEDTDSGRMDVIQQFMVHARRALTNPIPHRMDEELGKVFESRLGFNVYQQFNNPEQSGLLNSCTVLSISLYPEARVKTLH